MSRKVLVVLSEFGYWGEELVGPLDVLDAQGYESVFMTAKGKRAHALPPSMEEGYFDPPLAKCVTDEHYARRTREVDASTASTTRST
jgi:putative intracellular protease/amidase